MVIKRPARFAPVESTVFRKAFSSLRRRLPRRTFCRPGRIRTHRPVKPANLVPRLPRDLTSARCVALALPPEQVQLALPLLLQALSILAARLGIIATGLAILLLHLVDGLLRQVLLKHALEEVFLARAPVADHDQQPRRAVGRDGAAQDRRGKRRRPHAVVDPPRAGPL